MAVRRMSDGTWIFDTVAEAVAFEREMATVSRNGSGQSAHHVGGSGGPAGRRPDLTFRAGSGGAVAVDFKQRQRLDRSEQEKRAITAMELLAKASPHGLLVEEMQKDLGLAGGKGFSGVSQAIRNRIAAHSEGEPADHFFWKERRPGKPGRWYVNAEKLREIGLLD